jgi:predicted DNA-binding WGR domain protein
VPPAVPPAPPPAPKPAKTPTSTSKPRRFEFSEGTSNKFWEVSVSGCNLTVSFGKLGTAGQTKTKTFPSEDAAERERDALIEEKTGKGYRET